MSIHRRNCGVVLVVSCVVLFVLGVCVCDLFPFYSGKFRSLAAAFTASSCMFTGGKVEPGIGGSSRQDEVGGDRCLVHTEGML